MCQSYPSSGQPPAPERPAAPAPVQAAVKVMYAGAAVSAASLITSLAYLAYLAYLVGARDLPRAILDPHRPRRLADWGPTATVGPTARP
jgi:hypothetical protein